MTSNRFETMEHDTHGYVVHVWDDVSGNAFARKIVLSSAQANATAAKLATQFAKECKPGALIGIDIRPLKGRENA